MKKVFLFSLVLSVVLFSSCFNKKNGENINDSSNTFVDDLGRRVEVKDASRVSVLIGSFCDVWCLSGGKESIVSSCDDAWTQFDLGLSEDVIKTGGVKTPSLEKILSSSPTLVIASSKTAANVALKDSFEAMNIPVLYFNVSSFDDYLHMLDICTTITGKKENYKKYGSDIKKIIDEAISLQDGSNPSVLYVRASTSSVKIKNSENTVLGEMLKDLGCINIADSNKNLLESLSLETIIKEDPKWIFVILQSSDQDKAFSSLEKALLSNPAWNNLTAVKENRFIMLDKNLYNTKPNARWGEAYLKLSRLIYEKN